MIDLKIIRDDPDRIKAELKKRGSEIDVDRLVEFDSERRKLQAEFDQLRAKQKGIKDAKAGGALKAELKTLEDKSRKVGDEFDALYLQLPNFSADGLPEQEDAHGPEVGKKPSLKDPKPHYEIAGIKPLIDFERGAKVSGNRFWFLKGALVHLEFGLIRYAIDFYAKRGFELMRPPAIVRESAMTGTGFFPAEASEIYALDSDDPEANDEKDHPKKYLAGTAEVPLASYHAGETLDDLPVKYIGFSPAYRREAGSYGKDSKGIFRGHEFDKLELFIFSAPEKSWDVRRAPNKRRRILDVTRHPIPSRDDLHEGARRAQRQEVRHRSLDARGREVPRSRF